MSTTDEARNSPSGLTGYMPLLILVVDSRKTSGAYLEEVFSPYGCILSFDVFESLSKVLLEFGRFWYF